MKIINTAHAPAPVGPYSQGIEANGFVFFSGQIALTPNGDFIDGSLEEQALQVFTNLDAVLAEAGLSKKDIVKSLVFLDDLADFNEFNQLYADWLDGHQPARSCVQAVLPKEAKVEVEVVAARP